MSDVMRAFFPLHERLEFLSKNDGEPVRYRKFAYDDLIDTIKEDLLKLDEKQVGKAINNLLVIIKSIGESVTDFSRLFYDPANIESEDLHNYIGEDYIVTRVIKEPVLDIALKEEINNAIYTELDAYKSKLEFIKEYLSGVKKKQAVSAFEYIDFTSNSQNLIHLLEALIEEKFISPGVSEVDFKQVFSGVISPARKVRWIGNGNALRYFIKELFRRGLIVSIKPEGDRIRACFYADSGLKYVETAEDPEINTLMSLRKIIGDFERRHTKKPSRK